MTVSDERLERIETAIGSLTEHVLGVDTKVEYFGVQVGKRLDTIDKRLDNVDERLNNVDERLGDVARRLGRVEVSVEDLKDEVSAGLAAIDKDAETVIDHERRIVRIEKVIVA